MKQGAHNHELLKRLQLTQDALNDCNKYVQTAVIEKKKKLTSEANKYVESEKKKLTAKLTSEANKYVESEKKKLVNQYVKEMNQYKFENSIKMQDNKDKIQELKEMLTDNKKIYESDLFLYENQIKKLKASLNKYEKQKVPTTKKSMDPKNTKQKVPTTKKSMDPKNTKQMIVSIAEKTGLSKCKETDKNYKRCCDKFFNEIKRNKLNNNKLLWLALHPDKYSGNKQQQAIITEYFKSFNNCKKLK